MVTIGGVKMTEQAAENLEAVHQAGGGATRAEQDAHLDEVVRDDLAFVSSQGSAVLLDRLLDGGESEEEAEGWRSYARALDMAVESRTATSNRPTPESYDSRPHS